MLFFFFYIFVGALYTAFISMVRQYYGTSESIRLRSQIVEYLGRLPIAVGLFCCFLSTAVAILTWPVSILYDLFGINLFNFKD